MPTRKIWVHAIDLKEMFKPWKGRIYPFSKDEREEVQKFVKDQLRKGYMLSQSLDDLGITLGECLGRTRWSSPLDLTTYLYYFISGCVPIITRSHVLPEHSMITWPCHMIWLPNLLCYLYLDPIIWLDIRDQMFEYVGNSLLSGALITIYQTIKIPSNITSTLCRKER